MNYIDRNIVMLSWFGLGIIVMFLSACSSPVTKMPLVAKPEVIQSSHRYQKEHTLAAGDLLEIVVYRNRELSRQVLVRADGNVSLPLLDDVAVAGLTIQALDKLLTNRYSERIIDPEVTVILSNAREPMVHVFGEVGRTLSVPLRYARTVAEALAQAGGMTRTAAVDQVALIRLNAEGYLVAHLIETDLPGQPAFYMALQNMLLQPDDLVLVPESNRSQFVRMISDYINTPFTGINQMLSPYFQVRSLRNIESTLP